jgi:hypothetical protein
MPIEAATSNATLNPLWPLGTDPKSGGDDHIRMIKSVLQATAGGAVVKVQRTVLTTSGTYTKPAGLKFLEVTAIGGGGGSFSTAAASAAQSAASGGGAGGSVAIKLYAAAGLAATESYVIGAAGAGGAAATAGGNTTFKGLTGSGGGAGAVNTGSRGTITLSAGGVAVAATGGDINVFGGDGGQGLAAGYNNAGVGETGVGGSSLYAGGYQSIAYSLPTAGRAGHFPGGGAAGACTGNAGAAAAGAAGGAGAIILVEYF